MLLRTVSIKKTQKTPAPIKIAENKTLKMTFQERETFNSE